MVKYHRKYHGILHYTKDLWDGKSLSVKGSGIFWDFSGGLVVDSTLHYRGHEFNPWSRNKIPHAATCGQDKQIYKRIWYLSMLKLQLEEYLANSGGDDNLLFWLIKIN